MIRLVRVGDQAYVNVGDGNVLCVASGFTACEISMRDGARLTVHGTTIDAVAEMLDEKLLGDDDKLLGDIDGP